MDIDPEISTYMEQWVSDDRPAQIEVHTWPEPFRIKKIFNLSVYDSNSEEFECADCGCMFREPIEEYSLSHMSEHAVLTCG